MSSEEADEAGLEYRMLPAVCLLEPSADGLTPEEAEQAAQGTNSDLAAPWLHGQPDEDLEEALTNAVDGARADLDIELGVVVINRNTSQSIQVNDDADSRAASLSKVVVAMSFLRSLNLAGTQPTETDRQLLEDSLVNSGNESTAALFNTLGANDAEATAFLAETYQLLGMTSTVPEFGWGGESTTAEDQSKVLEALNNPPTWLSGQDAALILDLMDPEQGDPHFSQHFGVGLLADQTSWPEGVRTSDVAVKNGWLPGDDGYWSVSTIGQATINGEPTEIVFTTQGAPNSECGYALLDELTLLTARKI